MSFMNGSLRHGRGCRVARALSAVALSVTVACGSSAAQQARAAAHEASDTVRYRLLLRHNPVDPPAAFRCYGRCQSEETPDGYLDCLSECPGFEITAGARCARYEVPPIAACLNVRTMPRTEKVPPGLIVVGVLGTFVLVVGAAAFCAASSSPCGYSGYPYGPYPPY